MPIRQEEKGHSNALRYGGKNQCDGFWDLQGPQLCELANLSRHVRQCTW